MRVRETDDDGGRRLLRIIRGGTGSVVIWRRARTVLLSVPGTPAVGVAEVTFTGPDRRPRPTNRRIPPPRPTDSRDRCRPFADLQACGTSLTCGNADGVR
ncbi:predicted protein [Streptomyces viridosporus ATCC 14672]|uniref:Predicted protein n=1 Tax=Streptomyces viridosporus (strain ATCC 14672 / DSM 40746 / JCM 4963 / KCTC 9882 / NRRL B-12104 / FH 1290) TaxID=566461 RepID=D5ZX41_STRV1|nr:predicted protein [Streptomyces viridosporus ATCC 14672]